MNHKQLIRSTCKSINVQRFYEVEWHKLNEFKLEKSNG